MGGEGRGLISPPYCYLLAPPLAPCSGLSPLLLMKKCYFMHKMCQIPYPNRRIYSGVDQPATHPSPSKPHPSLLDLVHGHFNHCLA